LPPEAEKQRIEIETKTAPIELWDGRSNHNNGWYIVRSIIPANTTKGAVEWIITPNVVPDWKYEPVIHVSQSDIIPGQPKKAVNELDKADNRQTEAELCHLTEKGMEVAKKEIRQNGDPI